MRNAARAAYRKDLIIPLQYFKLDILPRLKPWDSFGRERHHIGLEASVIAVVQEGFITRSQQ